MTFPAIRAIDEEAASLNSHATSGVVSFVGMICSVQSE
jgi:hypothetical protein